MQHYHKQDKNINLCAPRAYYVPFAKGQQKSYNRQDSERFFSLNGTWNITAYESVYDAEGFWEKSGEKQIPVPSCVQYFGYDFFQYTNFYSPFPYNPPFIPEKNPCYHFSRSFEYQKKDEKVYLVTEGVDSCFYLYINGKEVGFSQISHKLGEFDITPYLKDGENKIDMLVVKWCFGSYLECQDKWRFTGIFRDIYLLKRPQKHIVDYTITTDIDGENGVVTFIPASDIPTTLRLLGESIIVIAGGTNDYGTSVALGKPTDREDNSFYGGLHVLYTKIRENNPKAKVFVVLPIRRKNENNKNEAGHILDDYRAAICSTAKAFGYTLIDGRNVPIDPENEEQKKAYIRDGLHPNTKGHALYGEYLITQIKKEK
jgi:lysophospholipase L1-like esterase